jgi:sn-glycerol 3-phosphate transport system ATP-binding protein
MAEIALHRVGKSFGATRVLEDISLTIGDGEMMVILGPSGCGKSTLLRLIAGLERLSAGEIRIGGRRVDGLEPMDRDIAMVFQSYALYPHMSVYDNMAYGLRNRRTAKPEIDRRVREAAAILGLADLLERKPRQLSGGQRQRVAMGRAIVREPQAFLFDEPLSNLDAKLRVQMRHELQQLQRRLATTGVYVTHDQVEAMTLGDRLVVLNAGRIEQIGRPLEVYGRPASRFVAGFIGSPAMSFVDARLGADGSTVDLGGSVLRLPRPLPGAAGRPVVLGIRPEHLRPASGEGAALALTVEWVEALGADTVAHGRLPSGAGLAVRLDGACRPRPGDVLPLALEPQNLHLFSVEDGRRLPDLAA